MSSANRMIVVCYYLAGLQDGRDVLEDFNEQLARALTDQRCWGEEARTRPTRRELRILNLETKWVSDDTADITVHIQAPRPLELFEYQVKKRLEGIEQRFDITIEIIKGQL